MLRPASLKSGDHIRILTTARKVVREELDFACSWLENLGYVVSIGDTIGKADHQFGGSDLDRIRDFQTALDDNKVNAIWFARGGYGSVRILDHIHWNKFIEQPKWLIGFSDITIWHNLVNQFYGIQTLHAPMPLTLPSSSDIARAVLAKNLSGEYPRMQWEVSHYNKNLASVEGEIIGGNLSILYSLLGTKSGFNTNGKILFIEEIDEYLYHIDRMLMSLKLAGKLNGLKALVIGGFSEIKDNEIPFGKTYQEIILEHTQDYNYPVYFDFPAGHISDNRPVVLNARVRLTIDAAMNMEYILPL